VGGIYSLGRTFVERVVKIGGANAADGYLCGTPVAHPCLTLSHALTKRTESASIHNHYIIQANQTVTSRITVPYLGVRLVADNSMQGIWSLHCGIQNTPCLYVSIVIFSVDSVVVVDT
jgi:hypothetical protein